MANTFNNSIVNNVGTSQVLLYQTDANTKSTVVGINLANLLEQTVQVDIILELADLSRAYVGKNILIPANNSLAAIGGDQKLVLNENNKIFVLADTNDSVDAIASVLEIT